ncbi:MAG: hypothetical protein BWY20_02452 [Spirochaetes bacterium ADurb.Bin215]|nr:MAG: hypothetical protein BWY20_02452 [Spirochaetes bacterium ADurb.Bin215]
MIAAVVFSFAAFGGGVFTGYFYVLGEFVVHLSDKRMREGYYFGTVAGGYAHFVDIEADDFVALFGELFPAGGDAFTSFQLDVFAFEFYFLVVGNLGGFVALCRDGVFTGYRQFLFSVDGCVFFTFHREVFAFYGDVAEFVGEFYPLFA